MPSLIASLAPLALLAQAGAMGGAIPHLEPETARLDSREQAAVAELGTATLNARQISDWTIRPETARQVRIERRVTVRISPRSSVERQSLMAELQQAPLPTTLEERKMGKCVTVDDIAGVQTGSGDRLVLFLRDRRMVSARLEKACRARDFYSGFYLERNKDGKLCIDRDKLQSRAGANCELNRLRELVPVSD
jgi:hypothetical protein